MGDLGQVRPGGKQKPQQCACLGYGAAECTWDEELCK